MAKAMASGRATSPTVMPATRSWPKAAVVLRSEVTERGSHLAGRFNGRSPRVFPFVEQGEGFAELCMEVGAHEVEDLKMGGSRTE